MKEMEAEKGLEREKRTATRRKGMRRKRPQERGLMGFFHKLGSIAPPPLDAVQDSSQG